MLLAALLGAVGCGKSKIEEAAAIASEIEKTPKKAETILKAHDMTIEEFEETMYDIAADPELANQYEEARKKSK